MRKQKGQLPMVTPGMRALTDGGISEVSRKYGTAVQCIHLYQSTPEGKGIEQIADYEQYFSRIKDIVHVLGGNAKKQSKFCFTDVIPFITFHSKIITFHTFDPFLY